MKLLTIKEEFEFLFGLKKIPKNHKIYWGRKSKKTFLNLLENKKRRY